MIDNLQLENFKQVLLFLTNKHKNAAIDYQIYRTLNNNDKINFIKWGIKTLYLNIKIIL
jgi:hypothetical protein